MELKGAWNADTSLNLAGGTLYENEDYEDKALKHNQIKYRTIRLVSSMFVAKLSNNISFMPTRVLRSTKPKLEFLTNIISETSI